MRLIKMFGLASLVVVAAMALVGVTSASAKFPTQLCAVHSIDTGLKCPEGLQTTQNHAILKSGTVGQLLAGTTVLCLNVLVLGTPLKLAKPQEIHTLGMEFTGCGTDSGHDNCTVTVEELPLNTLLKTGLDAGTLEALTGRTRLQCGSFIDCIYDLEGSSFSVGAQHLTATETPTTELGGKFLCPNEGFLDGLLESLVKAFVLQ